MIIIINQNNSVCFLVTIHKSHGLKVRDHVGNWQCNYVAGWQIWNVIWLYIKCFTYINSFILATRPSWEVQHGMAHSFIVLDMAVIHVIKPWRGFKCLSNLLEIIWIMSTEPEWKLCCCLVVCNSLQPPCLPVLHLPEFAQTCPLSRWCHPNISSRRPFLSLSQHQGLFQWLSSLYQVARVLELQLQHQSFQWIFRVDFL